MPESSVQLDLFADSAAVARRNDVLDALGRRDAPGAREACRLLAAEHPGDAHQASLTLLAEALDAPPPAPVGNAAGLAEARSALAGPLATAAAAAFGPRGGEDWLRPLWAALARRCAAVAFEPSRPEDHAAPLWLRAQAWSQAAEATATIDSWRRIPAPLGWMAEARHRHAGADAAWPLLVELAWLSPRRLGGVLDRVPDPSLVRLRKRFEAVFEGEGDASDLAWFPAWLLVEAPALAPQIATAQPANDSPPEQAMRLLLDALALERQGRHHDLVARRRRLQALNGSLYALYLATR